jgi:hypothetical protein
MQTPFVDLILGFWEPTTAGLIASALLFLISLAVFLRIKLG